MTMTKRLAHFIKLESTSGVLLVIALLLAIALANTPLAKYYDVILDTPIQIKIDIFELQKPLLLWINDGLMAVFFMLLALEIKREVLAGELASLNQILLPVSAAIGGIIFPALIYFGLNYHTPAALPGWPIATTTDIAFALGVIALLGSKVPPSLKVFLVALSIVDDILAITIIAVFYTAKLSYLSLACAFGGVVILIILNFLHVRRIAAYMLVGAFIWICVLQSGIHATLAGVIIGFTIPYKVRQSSQISPLRELETKLHPWVAYLILPLFVFANGGITFGDVPISALWSSVPLGIILGLVIGKTFGVFSATWLITQLKVAKLPSGSNLMQLLGLSALTGIGFTMSLFLASLAFFDSSYESLARKAVIIGSFISCIVGVAAFNLAARKVTKKN